MPMPRLVAAVAVVLLSTLPLTACGTSESQSTDPSKLPTKVIDVTINGSETDPNGQHLDVAVGQRIELKVTADQPGEIHVHSDPEQELEYHKGSNTLDLKPIAAPGQVDVESHALDKLLFTLVAR